MHMYPMLPMLPRQLLPRPSITLKPTPNTTTVFNRFFRHSTPAKMPTYIVTCKPDASADQIAAAKKHAEDQGGKIGHEYNLIKGFSVEFPKDSMSTMESHEHVKAVELDQEVKTQ
ncbi:hypothetical protein PG989_005274 [Apiospora arundinis]|uniref:Peptidase inhibitor I9 n=4 Tax=Apiospora TaxID=1811811 RepID=A0ABR2IU36_9PEZI